MAKENNGEKFPIVDLQGNVIGCALRKECHGGSMILHPVVHLHVLRHGGYVCLQRRSMSKDIQPGKWDTAVGGHVAYGETVNEALMREAREELGMECVNPIKILTYDFKSDREHELINTFYVIVSDDFVAEPDLDEIEEVRFWHVDEIEISIGQEIFTPNFEQEFERIKKFIT